MTVSTSPFRVFVGIDVCKEMLDVHVLFPDASASACAFSIPNTPAGIDTLRQKLKPYLVQLLVVESTGGYERRLVIELLTAGLAVAVVNASSRDPFHERPPSGPRSDQGLPPEVIARGTADCSGPRGRRLCATEAMCNSTQPQYAPAISPATAKPNLRPRFRIVYSDSGDGSGTQHSTLILRPAPVDPARSSPHPNDVTDQTDAAGAVDFDGTPTRDRKLKSVTFAQVDEARSLIMPHLR